MIAPSLIEPGRPEYGLDALAGEYGVEPIPDPEPADEETAALVRAAEIPRRLAPRLRERLAQRGSLELYESIELPLTAVLAPMDGPGGQIDEDRMGAMTAGLSDPGQGLETRAD